MEGLLGKASFAFMSFVTNIDRATEHSFRTKA